MSQLWKYPVPPGSEPRVLVGYLVDDCTLCVYISDPHMKEVVSPVLPRTSAPVETKQEEGWQQP
jgi:hypothetical protein